MFGVPLTSYQRYPHRSPVIQNDPPLDWMSVPVYSPSRRSVPRLPSRFPVRGTRESRWSKTYVELHRQSFPFNGIDPWMIHGPFKVREGEMSSGTSSSPSLVLGLSNELNGSQCLDHSLPPLECGSRLRNVMTDGAPTTLPEVSESTFLILEH